MMYNLMCGKLQLRARRRWHAGKLPITHGHWWCVGKTSNYPRALLTCAENFDYTWRSRNTWIATCTQCKTDNGFLLVSESMQEAARIQTPYLRHQSSWWCGGAFHDIICNCLPLLWGHHSLSQARYKSNSKLSSVRSFINFFYQIQCSIIRWRYRIWEFLYKISTNMF